MSFLVVQETDDRQHLVEDDRVAQLQAQEVVIEDDLSLLREREERIRQLEVCTESCCLCFLPQFLDTIHHKNFLAYSVHVFRIVDVLKTE